MDYNTLWFAFRALSPIETSSSFIFHTSSNSSIQTWKVVGHKKESMEEENTEMEMVIRDQAKGF